MSSGSKEIKEQFQEEWEETNAQISLNKESSTYVNPLDKNNESVITRMGKMLYHQTIYYNLNLFPFSIDIAF